MDTGCSRNAQHTAAPTCNLYGATKFAHVLFFRTSTRPLVGMYIFHLPVAQLVLAVTGLVLVALDESEVTLVSLLKLEEVLLQPVPVLVVLVILVQGVLRVCSACILE